MTDPRRAPSLRRAAATLLALPLLAAPVAAQEREIQHHDVDDPEGRLLGFYAAALAFSGIGPGRAAARWEGALGLEISYVPQLSRAERTAGTDKPESSNLTPLLPRLRATLGLPGGVMVEGGWVPPVRVFEARAHLAAVALSRPVATIGDVTLTPRVAAAWGRARGAITCYEELAEQGLDHAVYYATVCHGRPSDDHFDPRQLSAELIGAGRMRGRALVPYLGIGARRDDVRFDVGVVRGDGSRDPDQPILTLDATRFFAVAGAEWRPERGRRLSGEVYYAPGSLITARFRLDALTWRGGDG